MLEDEAFAKADAAIAAAAEGAGSLADARAAFLEIQEYRPKGMETDTSKSPEALYGSAANTFKMALDALDGDQKHLARSYIKVARIKLEEAQQA